LIINRFDYQKKYKPALAALIRAVALIKDRIDNSLFFKLKEVLAPDETIADVAKTEFITIPYYETDEVKFRHENYFQSIRGLELIEREKVVQCYLDWMNDREKNSAEALFDLGRVMEYKPKPDKNVIRNLYHKGIEVSEKKHQYPLSTQILERLLNLFPSSKDGLDAMDNNEIQEYMDYLLKRGKFLSWTVEWEQTKEIYKETVQLAEYLFNRLKIKGDPDGQEELLLKIESTYIELANIEKQMTNNGQAIILLKESLSRLRDCYKVAVLDNSRFKEQWANNLLRTLNRLGVTYWFNGHYNEGLSILSEAVRFSFHNGSPVEKSNQLRDFGTLYIHVNPHSAIRMLDKGLRLLGGQDKSPKEYYLLQFQKVMAELIEMFNQSGRAFNSRLIESRLELLQKVFFDSKRQGFINEQGGSSLVIGTCFALLESHEAIHWFKTCISTSLRFGMLEFLWKAHVNMAQLCTEDFINQLDAAGLHAFQALELIENDLSQKEGIYHEFRYNLFLLPLDRILKILQLVDNKQALSMIQKYPELSEEQERENVIFQMNGKLIENNTLFVKKGKNQYFLMN
jgi:tetratricopeptide (TPR) repeat protein